MEYRKVIFKIEDGSAFYQKWKEKKSDSLYQEKVDINEGASKRSEKNREKAKQIATIFEPYLKEILAQFPKR